MLHTVKKLVALLLAALLTLSFAACGAEEAPTETGNQQLEASQDTTYSAETETTESTGDVNLPTQTEPDSSQPTVTEPHITEPIITEPVVTEPVTTEPPATEPAVTEPPVTEPTATEPVVTEPPVTQPPETQPPVTEPAPTTSPKPVYEYGNHYVRILNYTPAPGEPGHIYWNENGAGKYYHQEFTFDVDYKTITYEIWCGWDSLTQMAFNSSQTCGHVTDYQMTPEETYYFNRITEYENYTCGFENHYCSSQGSHQRLMREIANGCYFCGKSECVSFYARNERGLTEQDKYLCPEYDVYRDPWFYCQKCNMPTWQTIQDVTKCCHSYIRSVNCYECGVWVEAFACHTCKQEDIDAWNAK